MTLNVSFSRSDWCIKSFLFVTVAAPGARPLSEIGSIENCVVGSGDPKHCFFLFMTDDGSNIPRRSNRKRKPASFFTSPTSLRNRKTGKRRLSKDAKQKKLLNKRPHGNFKTERAIRAVAKQRVSPLIAKLNEERSKVHVCLRFIFISSHTPQTIYCLRFSKCVENNAKPKQLLQIKHKQ